MEINSGVEERFGMILSGKSQRLKIKNHQVQRSMHGYVQNERPQTSVIQNIQAFRF